MSIARAFTKRMKRGDDSSSSRSAKSNTAKLAPVVISSPVEFLSTTNVHALNAPNIHKIMDDLSSSSSTHSFNDSDFSSMIDRTFQSINGNYDSPASSPATPLTPPQDTKDFFHAISGEPIAPVPEVPQLPQRCPSHSKKAHVELSRKRSIQRLSPPPVSLSRAGSIREPVTMLSPVIQEEVMAESPVHPFGAELAKVNEIAEDFGISTNLVDEEEQFMATHGLHKFSVMDYITEITGMYGGVYEDNLGMAANPWI